jgi:hypothetical protein
MDMPEVNKTIYNLEQIYLRIGDQYDQLLAELNLPMLDPSATLDRQTTLRLALITSFQFGERLPDAIAAQATMKRKDWKYALRLPLKHPGFSAASLCKFRESLNNSAAALQEWKKLLDFLEKSGLYARWSNIDLEPGQAIATVCMITRFYYLKQAIKSTLSCLGANYPDFLRANALPHWYDRYKTGQLNQAAMLSEESMQQEAIRLGKDIQHLLAEVTQQGPSELTRQVEIQQIARLFKDEFTATEDSITWRPPDCKLCNCNITGPPRLNSPVQ